MRAMTFRSGVNQGAMEELHSYPRLAPVYVTS